MKIHQAFVAALVLGLCAFGPVSAQVLDVELRREVLSRMDARSLCVGPRLDNDLSLQPIAGLGATEGYGSDNRSADFAWAVMVRAGASLMGNESARKSLIEILALWASAGALLETPPIHDAHFALKRSLLPVISSYAIIREEISPERRRVIDDWLGQLVTMIDHRFDGEVDLNNHRYLAESVLAAWGALTGNERLLDKAEARLHQALDIQMRPDGSFPLEARRGARALWYTRQTMASLTAIISSLESAGRAPLEDPDLLKEYEAGLSFLLASIRSPLIIYRYAAANYIPGPEADFTKQDLGFMQTRPHGRHYLAFLIRAQQAVRTPELRARIQTVLQDIPRSDLPLIDEFIGGNATCFWARPDE